MKTNRFSPKEIISRIVFLLFFAAAGLLIIAVFSPYRPMLNISDDFLGRIILVAALAVIAIFTGKIKKFCKYREMLIGLFILAVTVSNVWIFARFMLDSLKVNDNLPLGFSLLKLGECFIIVITVILFTKLTKSSLGSIYIQKGNLKNGLIIGLIAFIIAAVGSIFVSPLFFGAKDLNAQKILTWLPWILIFVFANAVGEELLFRGLFLRKLEPLYGKLVSNIMIALVFTVLHLGVTYPKDQLFFLILLGPLALAWGYITQKTDSILASLLFHAGMDVAVILGIFSNLNA